MFLAHRSPAQDVTQPTISTDRPSIGTGTDLVPSHRVVVENGFGLAFGAGSTTVDWSEDLVRFGVNSRIELRTMLPVMQHTAGLPGIQRQDAVMGAKIRLPAASGWPVSAVASLSAPAGTPGVGSGGWDPSILLTTSRVWTSRFSTFDSAGVAWTSNGSAGRERNTQAAFDGLWSLSSKLTAYAEWAPLFERHPGGFGSTSDAGLLWLATPRLQFDVRAGAVMGSNGTLGAVVGAGCSFSVGR
jgi:hypothetical protein